MNTSSDSDKSSIDSIENENSESKAPTADHYKCSKCDLKYQDQTSLNNHMETSKLIDRPKKTFLLPRLIFNV